ncbi:hypothetical protein K7432_006120 [Basidiobolus ranarum]|uniref:Cysteine dioxygenase n=1 Tax=Basidiobolus ranarum TaxID=34480 RepID=A0ABR2WVF9_9FUNG
MSELVKAVRNELGDDGLDSANVDVNRVMEIMNNYQSNASDWEKYALFDKYKYTRNLVDDGNGQFNLIVLCWSEGQQSPIHNHAGSHCVMKILDGELVESQYHWPENFDESQIDGESHKSQPMSLSQKTVYERDQVAYISDQIGLHRVANASPVKKAISLHLYTPPIESCETFCEDTSEARRSGNCVFHSIHGYRPEYKGIRNDRTEDTMTSHMINPTA